MSFFRRLSSICGKKELSGRKVIIATIFIITADDFFKIIEGRLNPVLAFTSGKLKIQGSIDKALEFRKISDRVKSKTEAKSKTEGKGKRHDPAAESITS